MLYFVATPIGNLKDISLRALEVLNFVDIIACEDTRKSLILLNHYNIKKRLISYHKNNEKISAEGILKLLQQGKNIAVISDSGMPVISDPGSVLIDVLKKNNQPYSVIPGANASLSALILSGLNSKSFSFFGFLPEKNKDRIEFLNSIKNYTTTLIFYVSPHNLLKDRIDFEHSKDFTGTGSSENGKYAFEDDNGHGTHTAGIIADQTKDNVKIISLKVLRFCSNIMLL